MDKYDKQDHLCGRHSTPPPATQTHLGPLASYPARQLDVLGHDGDPLGVDGAQVGVLEQTHQVRLAGLLQGQWKGRSTMRT